MTGLDALDDAMVALRCGALAFLTKPFEVVQLSRILSAELEQQRFKREDTELPARLQDRCRVDSIVGQSAPIRQVFSTLELVAPMNSKILIQGETGTGKELIAWTIHHNSPRADQRFVAFSAAAIPEGLAEAELFGHTKGACTGAFAKWGGPIRAGAPGNAVHRRGRLMPLPLQSKLLRALKEHEIERLGNRAP